MHNDRNNPEVEPNGSEELEIDDIDIDGDEDEDEKDEAGSNDPTDQ